MADLKYDYYIIFGDDENTKLGCIESLGDEIDDAALVEGVKILPNWPEAEEVQICEDSGDIINDFIENICRCVILSETAKDVLIDEGLSEDVVEYLPFVLKDKKGRVVKQPYYFANPIVKVDCLDTDKSRLKYYSSGKLMSIKSMHVLKDKIPEDAKLFRLGEMPHFILIRSDLADCLRKETSGFFVAEMGDDIY